MTEAKAGWKGPVFFLTGLFFLNFMARITFSPLMPVMEKDLEMGHADAGFLFLMVSAGYFVTVLCSGFVSARINHRRTIVISSISAGVVLLLVSLSRNATHLAAGLFVLGMAAGLYLPSGIATITGLVEQRRWGQALAVHEIAPNLSFVAAPLVAEALLRLFEWRGVVACLGAASLAMGVLFWRFGKGGGHSGTAPNLKACGDLARLRDFWIMTVLFGLGIAGSLGVYTMLPLFLVSTHGMERGFANTLIAFSRVAGMAAAFAAGWTTDRFGARRTMIWVFLATGLATIALGTVPRSLVGVFVFIQPLLAVCFFPAGFAAVSSIAPPNARNLAVSLTVPSAFVVGGGLIPLGVGLLGDHGAFEYGVWLTGAVILSGAFLALLLDPNRGRDLGENAKQK